MRLWLTFVGGFLAGGLTVAYVGSGLREASVAVSAPAIDVTVGEQSASEDIFNSGRASDPEAHAWIAVIRAYESRGDIVGALALLRDYQIRGIDDPFLWLETARLQRQVGNASGAIDTLFEYVALEPDAVKASRVLASLKEFLFSRYTREDIVAGDVAQAIEDFDRLLRLSPDDVSLHWRLALLGWQVDDRYSAHYHALIAVSDPHYKARAEQLLAHIDMQSQPDSIVVDLEHTPSGYIVAGLVNNKAVRLLVDTGASVTGLSKRFIDSYPELNQGRKQPIVLSTAGGSYRTHLLEVEQLSIDSLSFSNQSVAVINGIDSTRFDGLLGLDVLGKFEFFIDQAESALYLKRHR